MDAAMSATRWVDDRWVAGRLEVLRNAVRFTGDKTSDVAAKDATVTLRFADVVGISKAVSYWIMPNALTLVLSDDGTQKEHFAALVDRESAYDVVVHFWRAWWTGVLEVRTARHTTQHKQLSQPFTVSADTRSMFSASECRRLQIIESTVSLAAETAAELHRQTEQLDQVHTRVHEVNVQLDTTDRILSTMDSWFSSSTTAPTQPKSERGLAAAKASPGHALRLKLADLVLSQEAAGTPFVLQQVSPGTFRSRRLRYDGDAFLLVNESGAAAMRVPAAQIVEIIMSLNHGTSTLRLRDGTTVVLKSARAHAVIDKLRSCLPIEQPQVNVRKPRHFGASETATPIAWREAPEQPSEATGRVVVAGQVESDEFLQAVSSRLDDVRKIATAISDELDGQLETISAIDTEVDTASERLRQQTRRTHKLAS